MKLLDRIFGVKKYMDAMGCHLADMSRSSRYNAESEEEDLLPFLFNAFDKLNREVERTIIETQQMITYISNNNNPENKTEVEKVEKPKPKKSKEDPYNPQELLKTK
jgi:hypothetical protein